MPTTRSIAGLLATLLAFAAIAAASAYAHRPHTVQPGESLWSIAVANGVSVEQLATDNGLLPDAGLIIGSVIQVPEAPGVTGTGACVWDCASTVHPRPTDEAVSPGLVGHGAAELGMSSPLAEAIASVESGFDNSAVSSAGARGVMQIMPDTWEFIDEALTDDPLDPNSATANVEAGIAYLHHLYHLKGGSRDWTIGSYYQGPNRDRLLPETRAYIDLVNRRQAEMTGGG